MKVYRGSGLGDFYYALIRDITESGRKVVVRGHECIELSEPVALVYEKPGHCWMNIPKRRFNPFFALAEVYWILSGNGSAEWIGYFNKRMLTFRDGERDQLHGAYGTRIRKWPSVGEEAHYAIDQIKHVVRKLRADPNSRQAVISLWDPLRDNQFVSNDYPCNNLVYYSLRNGTLDQTVVIRSNDAVWGTPYNAVQYSHLHALVAGELEAEIGRFTYVVQNLHYYFELYKETLANVLEKSYEEFHQTWQGRSIDAPMSGPGALVIPNFNTVTDEELDVLGLNVDQIFSTWSKLSWVPLRKAKFSGTGYWCQTISRMIWLFRILKEGTQIEKADKEYLAESILSLGTPLTEMILDFLGGSELKVQKEVFQICQDLTKSSAN